MSVLNIQDLADAAKAAPHQTWAAFTDDSGSKPHTNLVSFTTHTECVLSLPGRHKNDPLVAYLWAAQPAAILQLIAQHDALLEAVDRLLPYFEGEHPGHPDTELAHRALALVGDQRP